MNRTALPSAEKIEFMLRRGDDLYVFIFDRQPMNRERTIEQAIRWYERSDLNFTLADAAEVTRRIQETYR